MSTFKYVLKRIALMLVVFFIIMTMCFILVKLLPMPEVATGSAGLVELARREALGYNEPIMVQYGIFLKNVFTQWDWGTSWKIDYMKPVGNVIATRLVPTVIINVYSIVLSIPIGIGLGIFAALKKNKWQDQLINVIIILLISVPGIVLALMLQYVFCFKLNWFPIAMSTSDDYFTWEVFRSMIPAVFALCLGSIAGYARYTRAELSEVLTGEFMLLARKQITTCDGVETPLT